MMLVASLILIPKLKGGETWTYSLTSTFQAQEFTQSSRESVKISVVKVSETDLQVRWTQKLESTTLDDVTIPTDGNAKPAERTWTFHPSGRVVFTEFERNTQEGMLQRIFRAIFERDSSGGDWVTSFEDETAFLQPAAIGVLRETKNKVRLDTFSYRQADGSKSLGQAVWHPKLLFPELLTLTIPRTKLPGGTDWGQSKVELRYIPPTSSPKPPASPQ